MAGPPPNSALHPSGAVGHERRRVSANVDMAVTCQVSHTLPVLTIVRARPSVSRSSLLDRSGGTVCERRLTLLIFADWVPPDFCASRSCLTLGTDISAEADALNVAEDSPPATVPPNRSRNEHVMPRRCSPRRGRHLPRNRPDEPRQLSRDRRRHFGLRFAPRDQPSEAGRQTELGLPRNITHDLR